MNGITEDTELSNFFPTFLDAWAVSVWTTYVASSQWARDGYPGWQGKPPGAANLLQKIARGEPSQEQLEKALPYLIEQYEIREGVHAWPLPKSLEMYRDRIP